MAYHIVLITTAQPSNNPRMVKEYKALREQGYFVKVLYSYNADWATQNDEIFFNETDVDRTDFILVGGSRKINKTIYYLSRLILKFCRLSSKWTHTLLGNYSIARTTLFLQTAARKYDADLYIGHNIGALPVVVKIAEEKKTACGFDLEDYYSGEVKNKRSIAYKIAKQLEEKLLPKCNYVTYSSQQIADAYQALLGKDKAIVIRNVVEKSAIISFLPVLPAQPLKLAWFSQHIGAERGLETVIEAINKLPELHIELHLLGNCSEAYKKEIYAINNTGSLFFYSPIAAKEITSFLKSKHIGLATETARDDNNNIALSNKLFTYLAAGNAIIATDTSAQKAFIDQHSDVGYCYKKNNVEDLIGLLRHLYARPHIIDACRAASLALAQKQLNWDVEKHLFTNIVAQVL